MRVADVTSGVGEAANWNILPKWVWYQVDT